MIRIRNVMHFLPYTWPEFFLRSLIALIGCIPAFVLSEIGMPDQRMSLTWKIIARAFILAILLAWCGLAFTTDKDSWDNNFQADAQQ